MIEKIVTLFLIFIVATIFSSVLYLPVLMKTSDEIQSKREWSVLQKHEFKYRGHNLDKAIIVQKYHDYFIAGIVVADLQDRVWILLNSSYKPIVKELPEVNYNISQDEYDQIILAVSEASINQDVKEYLKSKIQEEEGERGQN